MPTLVPNLHGDNTCPHPDKTQPANKCYCDTLLKPSTALSVVLTTTRPSCSGHLIKLQTLIGLINVPAKFHKWGIDCNWFHTLIHLLKWHSFIHVLTCFATSPLQSQRACYYKLKFHRKNYFHICCGTEINATTQIQRILYTAALPVFNLLTTWLCKNYLECQADQKCNFPYERNKSVPGCCSLSHNVTDQADEACHSAEQEAINDLKTTSPTRDQPLAGLLCGWQEDVC